jgi:cytochrome d ubiquinol oxidase subunit I
MEALYKGGTDQPLTLIAGINPFRQPEYEETDEPPLKLAVPYALSFLATNDVNGYVPGIRDILDGYTRPDGVREPSLEEKIKRGQCAITALQEYRKAKKDRAPEEFLDALTNEIRENIPYFGYGYVKDRSQVVPYIPVCFYAFRIMVGGGCLFVLLFLMMIIQPITSSSQERKTTSLLRGRSKGTILWLAILCVPISYIVSEAGWLVAEFGRQPWTIQDMLPTWVGVSQVGSSAIMLTFLLFLILFTTLLAVEISIMLRSINRGPDLLD